MNIILKYYGLTFLKLWAIYFFLGIFLGSLEWFDLAWQTAIFSVFCTGLIALTIKYCPTYAQLHWGIKKEN